MELKNTIEMMISEDHKERLKAEFLQLQIRITGLERMLKKYKEGTLDFKPNCSYELLYKQLVFMKAYEDTLYIRLIEENINI